MQNSEPSDSSSNSPESKSVSAESSSPVRKRNPFLEKMRGEIKSKPFHHTLISKETMFENSPTSHGPMTPDLKPDIMTRKTSCLTPIVTGKQNFLRIQKDLQSKLASK